MYFRAFTTTAIAGALALGQAAPVEADAGDFIGGAIVGGVLGHVITKDQEQKKRRTTTQRTNQRVYRPGIPSTQQGVQTQTALNYFGYNAGRVDGQVGPGTRRAIEAYQVSMGYPVNGRDFAPYQFDFLMQAYYWAQNGGQAQTGLAGQPLLLNYKQRVQTGTLYAGTPQATVPVQPGVAPVQAATPVAPVVVPGATAVTPGATAATPAPEAAPAAPVISAPVIEANAGAQATEGSGGAALPTLFAGSAPSKSLANACNAISLQSTSNGGITTLDAMSNPDFALSEQFCLARSHAIAKGEEMMSQVQGLTADQIAAQCVDYANMLKPQADAVSLQPQPEAEDAMRTFALGTGITPADLSATSRVCLSVGYSKDNMQMAIGSALMLTALGEPAYGELLGHHLREGFGVTQRVDLAMGWYEASLSAIENGAAQSLVPGQAERPVLLREATIRVRPNEQQGSTAPQSGSTSAALPTFNVAQ